MPVSTTSFVETEGSPSNINGNTKEGTVTITRTFEGPWLNLDSFLGEIFGGYDIGPPITIYPPTLTWFIGYPFRPVSYQIRPNSNQPTAKIESYTSIYWGPGETDDGESAANATNTAWGCIKVDVTYEIAKGSLGEEEEEDEDHVYTTEERSYSVEVQTIPNHGLVLENSNPLPQDVSQYLLLSVVEVTVKKENMFKPNFSAIEQWGGRVNSTLFRGFGSGELQYLGANVTQQVSQKTGQVVYNADFTFTAKYWTPSASSTPISVLGKTYDPEDKTWEKIFYSDSAGAPTTWILDSIALGALIKDQV